ncbi:MAG: segregation/condensation protein A [Thermoflexales bacterium]|nr:segregation/condensation protein A [Thermoflexales bacterium]
MEDTQDTLPPEFQPDERYAAVASALPDAPFTLRLPNYEGPLDVLLRLVEERELEITAVSLALVADQFIAHMLAMPARDPKSISSFLSIAARLILLKSRALLPTVVQPVEESEDVDTDDLVAQLRAYQVYKRAARILRAREESGLRAHLVSPPPIARPKSTTLPLDNITVAMIARAMQRVVDRLMPPENVDTMLSALPFTVTECQDRILDRLKSASRMLFTDVLVGVNLRVEICITLLALLELLKRYEVRAWQDIAFGEIFIEPFPASERPAAAEAEAASSAPDAGVQVEQGG